MLFIGLKIGKGDYAIAAKTIVEVMPLVDLKPVPLAPQGVVGVFDYRGVPIPVIDLSQLAYGVKCRDSMTTRIAVVSLPGDKDMMHKLGLVAEDLSHAFNADPDSFEAAGVNPPETPFLGPVLRMDTKIIQLIDVTKILPAEVSSCLFNDIARSTA